MRIFWLFATASCLANLLPLVAVAADAGTAPAKPTAVINIDLPGSPFGIAMSRDGNWVFVAISGGRDGKNGVALIKHEKGKFELQRVVPLAGSPAGIVLTHDEKCVAVTTSSGVALLDARRMTSGSGDPIIAQFNDGDRAGSIYVNVTADDKILFVSDERAHSISVIDLDRVRTHGYDARAVVGKIPTGLEPIALTFSPDGRWLYTTSEQAMPDWGWPATEKAENARPNRPNATKAPGAVIVVDVARARTNPANAVIARVPAGDSAVRMTISPDGRRIYVTSRGSDSVLAFDTAKLIADSKHALVGFVKVGPAPVPVALIEGGKTLVVGNSNRFSRGVKKAQTLTVIDVARVGRTDAVIGTIPAGSFPREMCVSADGKTLLVANFGSKTLEIIDVQNPPIDPK